MNKKLYNLTNPQKNIWNTEQYYSGTSVNNVGGTVYLKTPLDFNLLSKAVSNVVLNNDNFHLKIVSTDEGVKQFFDDPQEYIPEIIDINDFSELCTYEEELCSSPFSVENNNLFSIKIFRFPNNYGCVTLIMHHLISDSWTLGLFCKKMVHEYNNLIKNIPSTDKKFSYSNFIDEEQKYLNSSAFIKDQEFWTNLFTTVPEAATIPSTSKKASRQISCTANRQKFNFSASIMENITKFCKEYKISIYNFFMSIYSLYIGRVSNLDNFVIGTPILNRLNFADKNTNGMFVSTVPLCINIQNEDSFINFSQSIARNSMSMLRHQRYPYEKILEDLRKRDSNLPNLYNVILSYQITSTVNEDIDCESHWIFNGSSADDLQIHIVDYNNTGSLDIFYDYKTNKYTKKEISNVHARINHIIEQILHNNTILVSNIDIVTEEEKQRLLYDFNDTTVGFPRNKSIVDLFEEQVIKTPNNIAVVLDNKKMTYTELNEKSNQLARYLIQNGVKKNDVIGLRVEKSFEMIIGILAIIKAGCTYLPINLFYPSDRVEYMLEDSGASILLTSVSVANTFSTNLPTFTIDLSNTNIYSLDTTNLSIDISPEDLIYIIYTSGSTGKPKGAMICHRNVVRLFKNNKPLYDFSEKDVWTMFHSVAFDFSVWEMYGALLFGGKLVLVPDAIAKDTNLFLDLLRKEQVTILNQTPTYFYNLLNSELERKDSYLKLRYIIFGGEALKPRVIRKWKLKYPDTKLINMYGITETTVHVTFKELTDIDLKSNTSNIGKPIPTLQVLILDKNLNLLPCGVTGEMCVLGDGVFKGYLNRADLNSQKLVKCKFNDQILYRSGDNAILHADGNLEYLGRIDKQVKLRGFRVELGEIEEKILSNKNIKSCVVTKKVDSNNRDILCAYFVESGNVNIKELELQLKKDLAYYMVPQYFIKINKIPTNINGKTDFNALPLPSNIDTDKEIVPARNNIDKAIIHAFSTILKIKNISIEDSFFDLGGDSLSAIGISSLISKKLNINVSVKDILDTPVVYQLSDLLSKKETTNMEQNIPIATTQEFYPLSSAQRRIYYADKMAGNNNLVYNTPGAILLDSILDKDKVEQAFKTIIKNQSSFRTIFILDGEEVKQKVLDGVDFTVSISNDTEENINNVINKFPKPFDLENAPLLRVELCYIDNCKTLLLLDSHHIIMDGTSLHILIKDFVDTYNGNSIEKTKIEYKDYAVWEKESLESGKFKESEEYWLNKFKDSEFESLNLPYDYPIPVNRSYRGNKLKSTIDEELFNEINTCAKEFNMSPYILFIAGLFVTLYKYTGQSEIVIGSPVANRTMSEIQDLIGMFVNNIAIKNRIISSQTVSEFLKYLKSTTSEDLQHQNYPYDILVKKLNIPTDNSRNPLFDVVFTYQNQSKNDVFSDMQILEIADDTAKFNITLEVIPGTKQINIEYRNDLFKAETISSFLEHYIYVLHQMVQKINFSINDIDIITEKEQQLLNKFNNTHKTICRDTVAKIFEKQVELHPDDIAVICENKTLTYRELNNHANSLANYLIQSGIKPNDIVAIMTNRSLETIVCMIGILKAGAAFLNIDPTYPIERTEYYITDSKIQHVLTQRDLKEKVSMIKNLMEIDLDNNLIYGKNTQNPDIKNEETDLSYIIYTSGSTGTPKGVMLNQIGLSNMVQAMTEVLDYLKEGNKHTIASVTSTPFDIFVYEIIVSLTHGLRVVMANNAEHRNPKLLDTLIKKHNVDVMTVTPSLMKINYDNREPDTALANVKNMVFGGEPLPEKFVRDLKALADDITVYNIYGPSEITVLSNVQNLNGEKEITVGPPILNTQMYILDKNMKQVPIGVIGEIYIAGIQVGEGYIGKKELTDQKFLKNLFGPGKMYKSGDIGRWTFDGKIQCLGRIDNQVKLRGLRIELDEIEDKILKMSGVSSAIVNKITLDDKESLCAYYVAENNLSENEVKDNLRKSLPQYMVPTYVVKLHEMPYTINRKIDRKALPLPEFKKHTNTHINIGALDSTEEKLVQIWKNLLNIDSIDINDNFFDIGGDSILAINMQIEALKYGLEFEYADIFNFPTIKQLAQKLPHPEEEFLRNYDYTNINKILKRNNINNISKITKYYPGNILLIGGTGYLGAHIIDSFLRNENGLIYCLIRQKNNENPESRLIDTLTFYFGKDFIEKYSNRIKVVKGDITKENIGLSDTTYSEVLSNINVVVNAGALVKHFGLSKEFEDINVTGTQNIVNVCQKYKKRLIHTSTISVSGFGEKEEFSINPEEGGLKNFCEQDLHINQNIKGIYSRTKYKAEIIVLEAILSGLDAQILRIGNITNRYSDGKFQRNINDNAFARRIKSFVEIGAFPKYLLDHAIELTPVDLCADATIKILQYSSPCNIFHIYNPNLLSVKQFYSTLVKRGLELLPVSNEMMSYILTGILEDNDKKSLVSGIVQDIDNNKLFAYISKIKLEATFTVNFLEKLDFEWKSYDSSYINKCFDYFEKVNFINKKLEDHK